MSTLCRVAGSVGVALAAGVYLLWRKRLAARVCHECEYQAVEQALAGRGVLSFEVFVPREPVGVRTLCASEGLIAALASVSPVQISISGGQGEADHTIAAAVRAFSIQPQLHVSCEGMTRESTAAYLQRGIDSGLCEVMLVSNGGGGRCGPNCPTSPACLCSHKPYRLPLSQRRGIQQCDRTG